MNTKYREYKIILDVLSENILKEKVLSQIQSEKDTTKSIP